MVAYLKRTDRSRKIYPGKDIPDVFELSVDKDRDLLVGRLPRAEGQPDFCDVLQLQHVALPQLLSQQHSYIVLDENGCHCVRDLDSVNGTYVNGNLIPNELVKLKNGDVIGFGGPNRVCEPNGRSSVVNPYTYVYENDSKDYPLQPKKTTRIVTRTSFQDDFPSLKAVVCQHDEVWCGSCGKHIPKNFVCVNAKDTQGTTDQHYHNSMTCLSSFASTINIVGIDTCSLGEEHAQAKRLINSLRDYLRRGTPRHNLTIDAAIRTAWHTINGAAARGE